MYDSLVFRAAEKILSSLLRFQHSLTRLKMYSLLPGW